jgi:integrase
VALLTRPHIEAIMALIPNICARRQWLQAIKPLLQAAVPLTLRVNPAERVRVKIPKTRGHHAWIGEEIARYRVYWPLGTQQRLAMEFAVEAVSRRSEVFRLGPQHIRNGRIRVDRVHGSKAVDIPVTPEQHAACDGATALCRELARPPMSRGLGSNLQNGPPRQACRRTAAYMASTIAV